MAKPPTLADVGFPPRLHRGRFRLAAAAAPRADAHETREFTPAVVRLAAAAGWLVDHPRPALRPSGRMSTAIMGHKGRPDLLMVRERLLLVELKSAKGRLTREQSEWLRRCEAAGVEAYVWRPSDWATIVLTLT